MTFLKLQKRLIFNFNEYFTNPIGEEHIKSSLDWGCGGGLLTKELSSFSQTSVLDISEDSLKECEVYARPYYKQLISNNLEEFVWDGLPVDLILCHALVWHFPTLDYFKQIVNIWKKINPKYIAFNIKTIGEGIKETENYSTQFLQALTQSEKSTEEIMKGVGYKVNSKNLIKTGVQPQTYYTFTNE